MTVCTATLAMVNEIIYTNPWNAWIVTIKQRAIGQISCTHTVEKMETLMHHIFGRVIVFCFLRNDCHSLGNMLPTSQMRSVKNKLSVSSVLWRVNFWVVIATVPFGMGINNNYYCPDVCKVIHFHSPCTLLNYGQEIGRCERDGCQAQAKLFYSNTAFQSSTKKSKY